MRFGVQATAWSVVLVGFSAAAQQVPPPPTFVDATAAAGIRFRHDNGAAGRFWYPELFGGGVAVLDLDGDRWPDLLFVNGKDWQPGGRRPARPVSEQPRRHVHATSRPAAGFDGAECLRARRHASPTTTTTAETMSS